MHSAEHIATPSQLLSLASHVPPAGVQRAQLLIDDCDESQIIESGSEDEEQEWINQQVDHNAAPILRAVSPNEPAAQAHAHANRHSHRQFVLTRKSRLCRHCGATLFTHEREGFCCRHGKNLTNNVNVNNGPQPLASLPLQLFTLMEDQAFRKNMSALNSKLSLTQLGVSGGFVRHTGASSVCINGRTFHVYSDECHSPALQFLLHDQYVLCGCVCGCIFTFTQRVFLNCCFSLIICCHDYRTHSKTIVTKIDC